LAVGYGRSTPQGPREWRQAPPTDQSRVAKATLMALVGGSAIPYGQSIFFSKKKKKNFAWPLGVAGPPPRAIVWQWVGFGHPILAGLGWSGQTVALGGGLATLRAISKNQKKKKKYFILNIH
jgi:hypothetical protein